MIEEILERVLPEAQRSGISLERGGLTFSLFNNYGLVKASVVVFVFRPHQEAPGLILKLSRQRELIDGEYRALGRVWPVAPGAVPKPLASGETRGVVYLAMEGLAGAQLAAGRFESHAQDLLAVLTDIHVRLREGGLDGAARAREIGEPLRDISAWCVREAPDLGPLCATLQGDVSRLEDVGLPRVPQHGDCSLGNVMLAAGGRPVFVDWEDFGTVGVPGYDLVVLFGTLPGREPLREASLRGVLREWLPRYGGALGLDPRWLPMLVPLNLLLFLRVCVAEGRTRPAAMVLACLRQWADGGGRARTEAGTAGDSL